MVFYNANYLTPIADYLHYTPFMLYFYGCPKLISIYET